MIPREVWVALIFKYCDDNQMPLLDLKDFIKVLQYIGDEGKADIENNTEKFPPLPPARSCEK